MGWIICDVASYRRVPFSRNPQGIVLDMFTMKPRVFASERKAQAYAKASLFRNAKIEAFAQ